eukprot:gene21479-27514_t
MEKSIGEAAHALKKRIAKQEQDDINEMHRVKKSSLQLRKELLQLLQPGETLARAMRRLGGKEDNKSKQTNPVKRRLMNKSDGNMDIDNASQQQQLTAEQKKEQLRASRQAIHAITEIADELMSSGSTTAAGSQGGLTGIYDMTYESILASTLLWEYKGHDEVVYGPYTAQQISSWQAQGFLTGPTAVLLRPCGEIQHTTSSNVPAALSGGERTQAGQKAKFSAISSSSSGGGGGIYDDEELAPAAVSEDQEGPAGKKNRVGFSGDTVGGSSNSQNSAYAGSNNTASVAVPRGPWMNSDEVDFGSFVDLDVEERKQAEKEAALVAEAARRSENSNKGGRGVPTSSSNSSGSGAREQSYMTADDDDEEDEDDEVLLARRKKRREEEEEDE